MTRFWIRCAVAVATMLAASWLATPSTQGQRGPVDAAAVAADVGRLAPAGPGAGVAGAASESAAVNDEIAAPRRWLLVGGGATPAQTQRSMVADAREVAATLAGRGGLFVAAGHGARVVQTLDRSPEGSDSAVTAVRRALAELFAPASAERTRFTRLNLPGARPATLDRVRASLDRELQLAGAPPLLLWVATHGEKAAHANAVKVPLWGGEAWTPAALAALHDGPGRTRALRVVMTSCFSGGFGELVFQGANAESGAAERDRCGLFAAPWDLESSGCDPDPDRRRHRGYARVFLAALRGRDLSGRRLPTSQVDFDGDGQISLLDAHTRVRVASQSYDVPTTTSERWLRSAFPPKAAELPTPATALQDLATSADSPAEEWAVVRAMGARLRLESPLAQRTAAWKRYDGHVVDAERAQRATQTAEDQAYRAVSSGLLARWPALDDPWHPEFAATLATEASAVLQAMKQHPRWAAWRSARQANAAAGRLLDKALRARAWAERLLRAGDTLVLAARLRQRGGPAWRRWLQLRRCERFVPELRSR